MAEMSADEKLVRAAWKDTSLGGLRVYEIRAFHLYLGAWKHEGTVKNKEAIWAAAAEFTIQRQQEIAELREEILALRDRMAYLAHWQPEDGAIYARTVAREQAALAELQRGMKEAPHGKTQR